MLDIYKPLEFEVDGNTMVCEVVRKFPTSYCIVQHGETAWAISPEGVPEHPWMPTVRNKKRKPKKGEVWLCKWEVQTGSEKFKWFREPIRFDGNGWPLVHENAKHFEIIKPYYEPDYKD